MVYCFYIIRDDVGAHWGSCISACTCWNYMIPWGYTLGGGVGAAYVVVSVLFTLGGYLGVLCC